MAVTLIRTFDMELVRDIVTTPELWERFSDGLDPDDYYPSHSPNNAWLLVCLDEEVIGVIYAHCDTSVSVGFHPYLFKAYRKHARDMMVAFYDWFKLLPESIIKINAIVPECFASSINFARKMGFQDEGVSRLSYTHEGEVVNRIMLGITRKELEGVQ